MGKKNQKKSSRKTKASSSVGSVQSPSLPVEPVEPVEPVHAAEAPNVYPFYPLLSPISERNLSRIPINPDYQDIYSPDCPYVGLTFFDPEYIPQGHTIEEEICAGKWALQLLRKRVFCLGVVRLGNTFRFETATKTNNQLYDLSVQTLAPTEGEITHTYKSRQR